MAPHAKGLNRSRHRAELARALVVALAVARIVLSPPGDARAETTVPVELQVDLMRRVVRFERGFAGRGGADAHVLLVLRATAATDPVTVQLGRALEAAKELGGKPLRLTTHKFTSAAALKKAIADAGAQLVYFAPGFDAEMAAIATALTGVPVITVSTEGDQVDHGAVLGFELVSARPKIALNLGQARRQGLDFNSDLFRLARVIK